MCGLSHHFVSNTKVVMITTKIMLSCKKGRILANGDICESNGE